MTWLSGFVVLGALLGAAWVWYQVYGGKNDVVGCCGCGQCAFHGECVMVKKSTKKHRVDLTNPPKNV